MQESNTYAKTYALNIAQEVFAAERLSRPIRTDDSLLQAMEDCEEIGTDLDTLRDQYAGDAVAAWMDAVVLEVKVITDEDRAGRPVTRVEVLRTCGGPRCEITRDVAAGDTVVVTAWDGSDKSVQHVTAPSVAEWLDMYAEEVAR